jgi:hypothetical protein
VQSATSAKQVLEGHAMYEGGFNTLHLSYSVHHDLNVKNIGDKSRDYTLPLGVPSASYVTSQTGHGGQGGYGGMSDNHSYPDAVIVTGTPLCTA